MNEIIINEKISYIECSENPLSADIGIIKDNGVTWLYDVGNGENNIVDPNGTCDVVLSHFHQDHVGNIGRIRFRNLYVSKETYRHVQEGTIVADELFIGNLRIFTLPSSHARGCLGVEINHTYAFVGDALYSKIKGNDYIYNAQILKSEIEVIKNCRHLICLLVMFRDWFAGKKR